MPIIHVETDENLIIQFVKEKLKDENINQKYELPHIRSDLIICSRILIEKEIWLGPKKLVGFLISKGAEILREFVKSFIKYDYINKKFMYIL